MKRVSLAPVCLQVCNTFFFLLQILQESCLNKCPSVSLLQVTLECTSGPRAQQGSWLSHECEPKWWLTGRHLHFNDRHPETYKRSRQALTPWPLLWQAYHMPPLIRNFQCPCGVLCQLLVSFVFFSFVATSHGKSYFSTWVLEWEKTESRGLHKLLRARMGGGNKHWVVPTSTDRGCLGRQPGLLTEVPDVDHSPP